MVCSPVQISMPGTSCANARGGIDATTASAVITTKTARRIIEFPKRNRLITANCSGLGGLASDITLIPDSGVVISGMRGAGTTFGVGAPLQTGNLPWQRANDDWPN